MHGRWWDVSRRWSYEEMKKQIEWFQAVKDWGRLTDNFLHTTITVWGFPKLSRQQDWFSDEDWDVVLTNARLAGRTAKECGFVGILLDCEGYDSKQCLPGAWKNPWSYKRYVEYLAKSAPGTEPHSYEACVEKVYERGSQFGEALTRDFPDLVFMIYGCSYSEVLSQLYDLHDTWAGHVDGTLRSSGRSLKVPFMDGLFVGLDERATLVEAYSDYALNAFADMAARRNLAKEQAMILSRHPELARERISFALGIRGDHGWTKEDFSTTDASVNARDPERHKHAIHNALAVSDRYAWLWVYEPTWLAPNPTGLMREYWRANEEAHRPMGLDWEPAPKWDLSLDYSQQDREMEKKDTAFWKRMKAEGYDIVMELPTWFHFRLDHERVLRSGPYYEVLYQHDHWPFVSTLACWQSQGYPANGIGVYRIRFDAPADLAPEKQEILLGIGGFYAASKWADVRLNTVSLGIRNVIDVTKQIKPGDNNLLVVFFRDKEGPSGLAGQVKLMVRPREQE